jgi:hypothetical protein
MWTSTFALIYHLSRREVRQAAHDRVYGYETAVVQAFTAASNNFVSRHFPLEGAFFIIHTPTGACDRCRNCGVWCQLGAGISSHYWTPHRGASPPRPHMGGALSSTQTQLEPSHLRSGGT